MRSVGIVRQVDDLGRVVIPKETRTILGIEEGTQLEIFCDGDMVALKKFGAHCVFTGLTDDLVYFHGKYLHRSILQSLIHAKD